jgi:hypothetical protein
MKKMMKNDKHTLYLVGFSFRLNSDEIDLFTLIGYIDEYFPIVNDGKILFFTEPSLAIGAMSHAQREMRDIGTPPQEISAVFDFGKMLYLIENEDEDEGAEILDCINLFDDFLKALNVTIPDGYKSLLYMIADHLTFKTTYANFLKENQITREALHEAIKWCMDTIFYRSKVLTPKGKISFTDWMKEKDIVLSLLE